MLDRSTGKYTSRAGLSNVHVQRKPHYMEDSPQGKRENCKLSEVYNWNDDD